MGANHPSGRFFGCSGSTHRRGDPVCRGYSLAAECLTSNENTPVRSWLSAPMCEAVSRSTRKRKPRKRSLRLGGAPVVQTRHWFWDTPLSLTLLLPIALFTLVTAPLRGVRWAHSLISYWRWMRRKRIVCEHGDAFSGPVTARFG